MIVSLNSEMNPVRADFRCVAKWSPLTSQTCSRANFNYLITTDQGFVNNVIARNSNEIHSLQSTDDPARVLISVNGRATVRLPNDRQMININLYLYYRCPFGNLNIHQDTSHNIEVWTFIMKKTVTESPRGRWHEIRSVASGPSILLGLTASMGGFLFGADTGQISGFLIMRVRPFVQGGLIEF